MMQNDRAIAQRLQISDSAFAGFPLTVQESLREWWLRETADVDVAWERERAAAAGEAPTMTLDGCDCGEPGLPDIPGHTASCARWRRPSNDPAVKFLGASVLALRETLKTVRFEPNESGHCIGCGSDGHYDAEGACPEDCAVQAVLENTERDVSGAHAGVNA